jgi:hypothetical protein
MSLEQWLAGRPDGDSAIVDAVLGHLEGLGPVEVEAVSVGVLVRGRRTFVELRPRRRGLRVSIVLPHDVESARVRTRVQSPAGWTAIFVDLLGPDDVDDQVRGWLTESHEEFAE